MKTLLINGSPRPQGETSALIQAYRKGALGEVVQLDAFGLNLSSCTDCRACRTARRCVKNDGMAEVETLLAECDRVVIASPVWMGSLPAPLLALGSRLQWRWYCRAELPAKTGAILLTAGGSGDVAGARRTAELMLRLAGVRGEIPTVTGLATDTRPAAANTAALAAAESMAKSR